MAVPAAVSPSPSRIPAPLPSVSWLRMSILKGGVRKVRWVESGEERRNVPQRKAAFCKGVRGSAVFGGSGGRRAGRVDVSTSPASQARSRSGVVLSPFSRSGSGSGGSPKSVTEVVVSHSLVAEGAVRFNPRPSGVKEGRPSVCFSQEDIQAGAKKFRFALVIKFLNFRPPARDLQRLISTKWNLIGDFYFCEIWDSKHVVCILQSEVDVKSALRSQVRRIGAVSFQLFRWTVDFDPMMRVKEQYLWIRLPGIPLFLFDKAFAEVIVSGFATLSEVDECGTYLRCLNQMRVRVKVNVETAIPDKVWMELPDDKGYWQEIVPEGLCCPVCRLVGHKKEHCKKEVDCVKISNGVKDGIIAEGDNVVGGIDIDPREEPKWEVVSHRKNKKKGFSGEAKEKDHIAQSSQLRLGNREPARGLPGCSGKGNFVMTQGENDGGVRLGSEDGHFDDIGSADHSPINHVISGMASSKASFVKAGGPICPSGGSNDVNHVISSMASPKAIFTKDSIEKSMGPTSLNEVSNVINDSDGVEGFGGDGTFDALNAVAQCDKRSDVSLLSHYPLPLNGVPTHVTPRHENVDSLNVASAVLASDIPNGSMASPIGHSNAAVKGTKSVSGLTPSTKPNSPSDVLHNCNVDTNVCSTSTTQVGPCDSIELLRRAPLLKAAAAMLSSDSNGSMASPIGQSKAVPCDSLELLRKKTGRHKLAYDKEGQNDQISIAPMLLPEDKIASYGNDIVCYDENFVPLDARALYLGLKTEYSDDADIFHVMDHVYKSASQAQNDSLGEDSDGFIDLSRILKHPRQKSKGSRNSGRSRPKKKGSNVVY